MKRRQNFLSIGGEQPKKLPLNLNKYYQDLKYYESNFNRNATYVQGPSQSSTIKRSMNVDKQGARILSVKKPQCHLRIQKQLYFEEPQESIIKYQEDVENSKATINLENPIVFDVRGSLDFADRQQTVKGKNKNKKCQDVRDHVYPNKEENMETKNQKNKQTPLSTDLIEQMRKRSQVFNEVQKYCSQMGNNLGDNFDRIWREKKLMEKILLKMREKFI